MRKYKKSNEPAKTWRTDHEYEACVICGKTTDVSKDTDIARRTCYVEGAGQLCLECYISLFIRQAMSKDWQ